MAKILSNAVAIQVIPAVQPPSAAPSWVAGISRAQWTEIAASPAFLTAVMNLSPPGPYKPATSSAIGAARDAYCDWALDADGHKAYLFGGGHVDGTWNGVVGFDFQTLTYSLPVAPTTVYPPAYTYSGAPLTYPSGYAGPGFASAATLNANSNNPAADLPYAAAFDAPAASHTYGTLVHYDGKLVRYYGTNIVAELNTGRWSGLSSDVIARQLTTAPGGRSEYTTEPLASGTVALRDAATGRHWITMQDQSGLNWRAGLIKFNPVTQVVEQIFNLGAGFRAFTTVLQVGRYIYALSPGPRDSATNRYILSVGWRLHMDTGVIDRLAFAGTAMPYFVGDTNIETMPAYFDGTKIRMWSYISDKNALYDIDPTPANGAGTSASPYVLNVVRTPVPATGMPDLAFTYKLHYLADWDVVVVNPRASAKWWALRK